MNYKKHKYAYNIREIPKRFKHEDSRITLLVKALIWVSVLLFVKFCRHYVLYRYPGNNIVCVHVYIYIYIYIYKGGPDSSVGIATDYELGGPGSNPSGGEISRPSRPALGPTQPPVQWVLGLSRE